MHINEVKLSFADWLFAVECAGPIPSTEACETLVFTAPVEADGTSEYRCVGHVMQLREMRLDDAEILRRVTAWWEMEDRRAAA